MPSRRRSFNFLGLHHEQFEELTFLLAHLEYPDAVRPRNPDLGLDAVVLDPEGGPAPRGFQAKHFTRAPSWPQCRASLDDAVANYRVQHLTFTFPADLTGKQIHKFNDELAARHTGVRVDFWGATTLTARLIGSDGGERIARYIFGDDEFERLSRLIRARADVDTAENALAVIGAAGSLFAGDPYFSYSFGMRPSDVGNDDPAPTAVMRVEVTDGDGVRHIDAHARPAAIAADRLPKGVFYLRGEDAIRRYQEFRHDGGALELEGVAIDLQDLPKYFREMLGEIDSASIRLESGLTPRPFPVRFEAVTAAATSSMDFELERTATRTGWEHTLSGTRAGVTVQVSLRRRNDKGQLAINWTWRMRDARTSREQLAALSFIEAFSSSGEFRLLDARTGAVMSTGPLPERPLDEHLTGLRDVIEDLVTLEDWLGTPIATPNEINATDADALRHIAHLIEGIDGTWTDAKFTLDRDRGSEAIPDGGILQVRHKLAVRLFGTQLELGDEVTYLMDTATVSNEPAAGGRTYFLEPRAKPGRCRTQLERSRSPDQEDRR